jgi:uncharacterized protein YydD (DUF2326 family)
MFLKSLIILKEDKVIREVIFRSGINLIVDETPSSDSKATGNNIGKTTILKLVDFCLGGDARSIYIDPETKKDIYSLIKNFLIENKVLIRLTIVSDLNDDNSSKIVIERNFLAYKEKIQKINGENLSNDEFVSKLSQLIIPELISEKPTFRQVISHNIRYKDENINNTLKTLDKFSKDAEYEALYLFLFGCEFTKGNSKQDVLEKLRQENVIKSRLEKYKTKTAYEAELSVINAEIEKLNRRKKTLNINENFELDLDKLNKVKYEISRLGSEISQKTIRKDLIIEAEKDLNLKKSDIDLQQLKLIYQQASSKITDLQKTFDDLVGYHNKMIVEKVKFVIKELPEIESNIKNKEAELKVLLVAEKALVGEISRSSSFEDFENLISELNERFQKKGEYEKTINQLVEIEDNIKEYSKQVDEIDGELFSDDFEQMVKRQLNKFNLIFSDISNQLYGEKYLIKHDIELNRQNKKLYKFSSFNTNLSSGKKQGEISCFDIAYTLFADQENISCLHFLLNDKKELMHDHQLVKIADFVNDHNIQFVASILKDKLPEELNRAEYFIVELSQKDKLFRIEDLKE